MIPGTQRIRSQPWAADIQNHPPDPGSAVSDLVSRRHHCWSGQHQREGDCGACWERWVRLEFKSLWRPVSYLQSALYPHALYSRSQYLISNQTVWSFPNSNQCQCQFLSVILFYLLNDYVEIVQLPDKADDSSEHRVILSLMLSSLPFPSFSPDGWCYCL